MKILLIDADIHAAEVTREIVARAVPWATIRAVADPQQAHEALDEFMPHLLIIDPTANLRQMLELITILREHDPQAKILVLAGEPTPSLRRKIRQAPVDTYLEKPIIRPDLTRAILALLGQVGSIELKVSA